MAEGCIQDASMLQALQACRQAAKVGEMLPALLRVSYRLSSGEKPAAGAVPMLACFGNSPAAT